jgi:hypothetical protein
MSQTKEISIMSKEDLNLLDKNLHHIHLDLSKAALDKEKFAEAFHKIQNNTNLRQLQLDLSNCHISDEEINIMADCLSKINLNHFHLDLTSVDISENQLERILKPLYDMTELQKLHFAFENVEMSKAMKDMLHDCFKKMPHLKNVRLNVKNNKTISDADISNFKNVLSGFNEHMLIH